MDLHRPGLSLGTIFTYLKVQTIMHRYKRITIIAAQELDGLCVLELSMF